MQERDVGAGCQSRAAVADAARRGLILPPHAPGAKGGCLLCLYRRALCCDNAVCGRRRVKRDGCFGKKGCVCGGEGVSG